MENNIYDVINLKLQAHKTPVFKEEKSKEWIIYGADKEGGYYNNYPGYLLYLLKSFIFLSIFSVYFSCPVFPYNGQISI